MELMRNIRNFVILTFLWVTAIVLLSYTAAALFTALVWGPEYITITSSLINNLYTYIIWFGQNVSKLGFAGYNYLGYKLIGSIIATYGLSFFIIYRKWEKVSAWRPYKKKESVHGDARDLGD